MMKKFLISTFFVLFSLNLFAHGNEWIAAAVLLKDAKWSPVQISVWPVHLCSPGTDVYGLAVSPGLFGFANKVYGISCGQIFFLGENNGLTANLWSYGDKNNGVAAGLFNAWAKNNGVVIGAANFSRDKKSG